MVQAIMGKFKEDAYYVPGQYNARVAENLSSILSEYHEMVFIPESALPFAPNGETPIKVDGVADDNRSLIVPSLNVNLPPMTYYLESD